MKTRPLINFLTFAIACLCFISGCRGETDDPADSGPDTDGDTFADADSDSDVFLDPWRCLGDPPQGTPTVDPLELPLEFVGYQSGDSVQNVNIRVCPSNDRECTAPIDEQTSGSDGEVTLSLPQGDSGFEGFGLITGPDLIPMIVIVNVPIVSERSRPFPIPVASQADLDALALEIDYSKSHFFFLVLDCDQQPGADAAVELSTTAKDSIIIYNQSPGVVSIVPPTADTGSGGIFNLPEGDANVVITHHLRDEHIATASPWFRNGSITLLVTVPN